MPTQTIEASELRRTFFDTLKRMPFSGPIDITRHGEVVARLVPPDADSPARASKPVIDPRRIARLCQKHRIIRLALFGSVLRDDFHQHSDIDVLVDTDPRMKRTLETCMALQDALEALFGRRVDVLERRTVMDSSIMSREILETAQVIYAAT